MRREIVNDIHVALKQAEIDPDRIDIENISQIAAVVYLFYLLYRPGKNERMINGKNTLMFFR